MILKIYDESRIEKIVTHSSAAISLQMRYKDHYTYLKYDGRIRITQHILQYNHCILQLKKCYELYFLNVRTLSVWMCIFI